MAGEKGKTPSGKDAGSTDKGTPAPTQTLEDVLKAIQANSEQTSKLATQMEWQRSVGDKRDQEYRQLLAARGTALTDDDDDDDDADPTKKARRILDNALADRDAEVASLKDQNDLTQFKMDNPDWKESWKGMQAVIHDPSYSVLVDVKRPNGTRDLYRSLSYAKAQADIRTLRAAQAEGKEAEAAEAERKRKESEAMGLTSGSSAASDDGGVGPGVDLSDPATTSDDILKALGPKYVDKNDPPKPLSTAVAGTAPAK